MRTKEATTFICSRNYLLNIGGDDYRLLYEFIESRFGSNSIDLTVYDYNKNYIIIVKDYLFGKGKKVTEPIYVGTDNNDYMPPFYQHFSELGLCDMDKPPKYMVEALKARIGYDVMNDDLQRECIVDYVMVSDGVVTSYIEEICK